MTHLRRGSPSVDELTEEEKVVGGSSPVDARSSWERIGLYGLAAGVPMLLAVMWLQPWDKDLTGVFFPGGDLIWLQAMVEVHSNVGLYGSDPHLAWPYGDNPWAHPQLGLGPALCAWILAGLAGLPSASSVWIIFVLAVGANGAALLYLFRAIGTSQRRLLGLVLAIALAASAYVLSKVGHLNVATFYVVPLAFGTLLRLSRRPRLYVTVSILTVGSMLSPLWWVTAMILVLVPTLLISVLRRDRGAIRFVLITVGALFVGFAFQSVLYASAAVAGAAPTRSPWDSNTYGGHLVDLLLSSPFLNSQFPALGSLREGASVELSTGGLWVGLTAIALVLLVLLGTGRSEGDRQANLLADLSVVSLMFFLVGGLGNLQAGLAILVGGDSPARTWSRFTIVMAILASAWIVWMAQSQRGQGWERRVGQTGMRIAAIGGIVLLAVAWYADGKAAGLSKTVPITATDMPEYEATHYLRSTRTPCPVAQLPQDGWPPRNFTGSDEDYRNFYLNMFIPFLIAPDFFWSAGSWAPERPGGLNAVPVTMGKDQLVQLREMGFCALMYDKLLGQVASERGLALEGRDLVDVREPDFTSPRYDVYNLD